jgi:hypothetical protein
MTYYRIDSAFAPTLEQAKAFAADGVKEYGLYIPGARVYHASSKQDFDTLRAAGLRPVFIHTGWDGNEAVNAARGCGAQPHDKVTLDVEANFNDTYSSEWEQIVKGQGFETELYGLDSEIGAHGSIFDDRWVARYTYPNVPTPPAGEAIQFENTHIEHGLSVDRSISNEGVVNPSPVDEVPMTTDERKDVARALTRLVFEAVGHRTPESQAAEDQLVPRAISDTVNGFDYLVRDLTAMPEFAADVAKEAAE